MAYMCIYAHSKECDGCGECQEKRELEYDNSDFEYENARDEAYIESLEREGY